MKTTNFKLTRYDADDGYVFDWAEPRYIPVVDPKTGEPDGEPIQEHLYVKTLFIGGNDDILNYIEVKEV